ncbi:MAG: M24B family metallopeptidase, partial [Arenicellales bacterium]
AEFQYIFRRKGSEYPAYPPIVATGENACILHYTENSAELKDGDMLLIDAGCEIDGYASDISRSFPVNGKFSGEQRALYEVVLAAQYAAIETIKPGVTWDAPHNAATRIITEGLVEHGLLQGDVDELHASSAYQRFYMHKTGHWLGLDVHDVGDYKVNDRWRELESGMVMTVEPGLYIVAGSEDVDERWWNIGIRIEDDVAVTKNGHEVLSEDAPKKIDDIEHLMSR